LCGPCRPRRPPRGWDRKRGRRGRRRSRGWPDVLSLDPHEVDLAQLLAVVADDAGGLAQAGPLQGIAHAAAVGPRMRRGCRSRGRRGSPRCWPRAFSQSPYRGLVEQNGEVRAIGDREGRVRRELRPVPPPRRRAATEPAAPPRTAIRGRPRRGRRRGMAPFGPLLSVGRRVRSDAGTTWRRVWRG